MVDEARNTTVLKAPVMSPGSHVASAKLTSSATVISVSESMPANVFGVTETRKIAGFEEPGIDVARKSRTAVSTGAVEVVVLSMALRQPT